MTLYSTQHLSTSHNVLRTCTLRLPNGKTEKQRNDDAISNTALPAETQQVVMAASFLKYSSQLFCLDALPDATNDLYKF